MKARDFYKPPPVWNKQKAIFIIGGGPSINDTNLNLIKKYKVIGVNNVYRMGDWVDVCWFGDCKWFDAHREGLLKFGGIKVTCCQRLQKHKAINMMGRGKPRGIETRRGFVSWNGNSGLSAISLAYHLGAKIIILLGFDMKSDGIQSNYHNEHVEMKLQKGPIRQQVYERYLKKGSEIVKDANKLNLKIINATPGSAMEHFPIMTLEEAMRDAGILPEQKKKKDIQSQGQTSTGMFGIGFADYSAA